METFETHDLRPGPVALRGDQMPAALRSPFAPNDLVAAVAEAFHPEAVSVMASPFTESFGALDESSIETEMAQLLLAELEDEEFNESLEALAQEAAYRYAGSTAGWNQEAGVPVADPTDVEQWVGAIGTRADHLLAELEHHFMDRSVETVTDAELDDVMRGSLPELDGFTQPLDAQELFWGGLKKKLKKVARAAKNVVKKGIRLAKKFLPLGMIYRALRPVIKPLLQRVLAKAIGKLPRSLQGPARQLAQKYGVVSSELENEFESLGAEFDLIASEAIVAPDASWLPALEAELSSDRDADDHAGNPAQQLDVGRERLTRELLNAEPGDSLDEAMEQFLPVVMAALPLVRTGIKLAGRRRVVSIVAKLIAKLIKPMVGPQLARPLSAQIADQGLALLKLEAESTSDRLGAEAMVATVEETIAEVFSGPDGWLDNELLTEMAVQEAFESAALQHFPGSVLRSELADQEQEDERGVWLMMPRTTSPVYRYKKYSRILPVRLTRPMARGVVFSDGETLEERLLDDGVNGWPLDAEVHAFELLPGSNEGELAAFETTESAGTPYEAAKEFDTLEEAGTLPLPADLVRSLRVTRAGNKKLVRIRVAGRGVRKRSPVAVRLDVGGPQPILRLHLWVSERRAHALVAQLAQQQHREVLSVFRQLTGEGIRRRVGKRLGVILGRRRISRDGAVATALSDALFDGFVAALATQLPSLAPTLTTAAKDPAAGLTVTAAFTFASKDAIGTAKAGAPTLSVRPGRHRD